MRRLWWMWKTSWWTEPTQDGEVVDRFVAMCAQTFGEKGFGELRWGLEMSRAWIYIKIALLLSCVYFAKMLRTGSSSHNIPSYVYSIPTSKYSWKIWCSKSQNRHCSARTCSKLGMWISECGDSVHVQRVVQCNSFLCAAAYGSVEWQRLVNESKHLLVKYAPATLISCILQQYYHLSNCFHYICGWSVIKSPQQCGIVLFEGQ